MFWRVASWICPSLRRTALSSTNPVSKEFAYAISAMAQRASGAHTSFRHSLPVVSRSSDWAFLITRAGAEAARPFAFIDYPNVPVYRMLLQEYALLQRRCAHAVHKYSRND